MTPRQKWFAHGFLFLFLTLSLLGMGIYLLTLDSIPACVVGGFYTLLCGGLSGAIIGGLADEVRNPVLK